MAGFALMIDAEELPTVQSPSWTDFVASVADYKHLEKNGSQLEGRYFVAAKLDAPCSLHPRITLDPQTKSWLMAVGTVVDPVHQSRDGSLSQLLSDFEESGARVFSRLDGQFALIAYHAAENSLSIISDHFGMIPVYYARVQSRLYIATSALAVARAVRSTLDDTQARLFLLYGDPIKGSLWKDVHTLKPATVLAITPGKMSEEPYWSFKLDPAVASLSLDDSVDCIIEGLSQGIKDSAAREGKVWVSLTGGLDSRTLAAVTHYSNLPFKTYCHGPSDSKDVRLSGDISQQMGWEYEYFALPADWGCQRIDWISRALGQTDGHMDTLKMCRTIREQVIKGQQLNVSLWGYGGEIYRGYYWKQEIWRTGVTSKVDYDRLLDYRVIPFDAAILKDGQHWRKILRELQKSQLRAVGEQQPGLPNTAKLDLIGQFLEHHAGGNTIAAILGQQRVLLPYYTKDNITRIISTNYRWRTQSRMFRLMLERINPGLAGIETADGGPALPMRLANAYKFIPYWLDMGDKMMWKLGRKYLGKALWSRRDAGPAGKSYPNGRWLQETISQLNDPSLLMPNKMLSASLYDENSLHSLLAVSPVGGMKDERLISRILTIEMALRTVGSTL